MNRISVMLLLDEEESRVVRKALVAFTAGTEDIQETDILWKVLTELTKKLREEEKRISK